MEKESIFLGEEALVGSALASLIAGEGKRSQAAGTAAALASGLGYATMPYTTLPVLKEIMSQENRKKVDKVLEDKDSSFIDKAKAVGSGTMGILKGETNKDLSKDEVLKAIGQGYMRSAPFTLGSSILTGLGYRYLG